MVHVKIATYFLMASVAIATHSCDERKTFWGNSSCIRKFNNCHSTWKHGPDLIIRELISDQFLPLISNLAQWSSWERDKPRWTQSTYSEMLIDSGIGGLARARKKDQVPISLPHSDLVWISYGPWTMMQKSQAPICLGGFASFPGVSVDVFLSMLGNKVYNVYKASGFYSKHFWGMPSHWVYQICERYSRVLLNCIFLLCTICAYVLGRQEQTVTMCSQRSWAWGAFCSF